MKRLLIDAQVFHTPALHRGMGKYSLDLLEALITLNMQHGHWDAIELIISSKMPLSQEASALLTQKAKGAVITKLALNKDVIYSARAVMKRNRAVIDRYVQSLRRKNPSEQLDFFILSPLQGGISSVFPSDPAVRRSLICYDLIPFMFHDAYFRNPIARIENLTKLTEFLKADIYLPISQTVGNDLSVHLGVDPGRIHNIDGGPINHSNSVKPYKVSRPFILMPTGNDLRKNNRTGVQGFNEFNKAHGNKYSLVVTSFFDPEQVRELSALAENVVFTGNISGGELNYLYQECEALLFPSEYEGLGLPVLEAVQQNRPVACSDIAVFREMSKTAFSFFDPAFGTSIAKALEAAIHAKISEREYKKILAKYDWSRTANLMIEALTTHRGDKQIDSKMPLNIFTQNPEYASETARMVQTAHAAISRWFVPKYFVEGLAGAELARPGLLQYVEDAVSMTPGTAITVNENDTNLYYVGNVPASARTLFSALARPGTVVLYDLDLTVVWNALHAEGLIDAARLEVERTLQETYGGADSALLCSLIAHQRAVGVYSEHAKSVVERLLQAMGRSSVPVHVLPYPASSLVYDDVLPRKSATLSVLGASGPSDGLPLIAAAPTTGVLKTALARPTQSVISGAEVTTVKSDLDFEDALSRTSFVYGASDEQVPALYDALRYGSVPVCYAAGHQQGAIALPKTGQLISDAKSLNTTLARLAPETEQYDKLSQAAMDELAEEHSFQLYAERLHALIVAGQEAK